MKLLKPTIDFGSQWPQYVGRRSISIRDNYEKYGVDQYYHKHCLDYHNPHSMIINNILQQLLPKIHDIISNGDKSTINCLDFACGNGLATKLLLQWYNEHHPNSLKISGSDPFLINEYRKNFPNLNTYTYSFDDVIESDTLDEIYDLIIISFAIHILTDEKRLRSFLRNISKYARYLLILSPTRKKGDFTTIKSNIFEEVFLEKLTDGNIKVFCRLYRRRQ